MKRFIAIFLTGIYLLASVGVAVNIHYCEGKIEVINLYAEADCCCDDGPELMGCCKDQTVLFQLDDEQRTTTQSFEFSSNWLAIQPVKAPVIPEMAPVADLSINRDYLDTPPPPESPIWLLNCSLTYYG